MVSFTSLYPEQLPQTLAASLAPCYWVLGQELLLIQESVQHIKHKAQMMGFEEHYAFTLNEPAAIQNAYQQAQSMSLFASKKLIELVLPDSGLNASLAKELIELIHPINPDILFIVQGERWTKAQERTAWHRQLIEHSVLVQCFTPDLARLPSFIRARCQQYALHADQAAIMLLAHYHEGNLPALAQTLEKLSLQYPDGKITQERLIISLEQQSQFTPFQWIDTLLTGDSVRAQLIVNQLLQDENTVFPLLRLLQKELLLLLELLNTWHSVHQAAPSALSSLLNHKAIWQNKRPLYRAALERLSIQQIKTALQLLVQCELLTKKTFSDSPLPLLKQMGLVLCQPQTQPTHLFTYY